MVDEGEEEEPGQLCAQRGPVLGFQQDLVPHRERIEASGRCVPIEVRRGCRLGDQQLHMLVLGFPGEQR